MVARRLQVCVAATRWHSLMAAERAFSHSTGVHNAKTLGRAKAVCAGLSAEEILISKGIPVAVSLLVGTAPAKASSR
jgi:hypothetical protein